jgi:hypothetical protein
MTLVVTLGTAAGRFDRHGDDLTEPGQPSNVALGNLLGALARLLVEAIQVS